MHSPPSWTALRRRYGTRRKRAVRNGSASSRGRGRRLRRLADTAVGAVLLTALALAVPVMVAANPVDPTWLPGLYDDADTDQLVSKTLSPENWVGAALPTILCLLSGPILAWSSYSGYQDAGWSEAVARGPPRLASTSIWVSPLVLAKHPPQLSADIVWRSVYAGIDLVVDDDDQGQRYQPEVVPFQLLVFQVGPSPAGLEYDPRSFRERSEVANEGMTSSPRISARDHARGP
jgi:hypothetical protein